MLTPARAGWDGVPSSPGRAGGSDETSRAQGLPPPSPGKRLCCRGDTASREQQFSQGKLSPGARAFLGAEPFGTGSAGFHVLKMAGFPWVL